VLCIERSSTPVITTRQVPFQSALPAALVLGFHGQGSTPEYAFPGLRSLARATGVLFATPAGIDEGDTGWNCGAAANVDVCGAGTQGACLASCQKLDKCGPCNWATCYDDVFFVEKMLEYIRTKSCVDDSRTFALGESNGGMFVHLLAQRLPGVFKAVAPVFASPMIGFALGGDDEPLRRTSLLQLFDRSDETIPWRGGASSDGARPRLWQTGRLGVDVIGAVTVSL
jgi:poly(3-hydroxybutyrate) depolymerase